MEKKKRQKKSVRKRVEYVGRKKKPVDVVCVIRPEKKKTWFFFFVEINSNSLTRDMGKKRRNWKRWNRNYLKKEGKTSWIIIVWHVKVGKNGKLKKMEWKWSGERKTKRRIMVWHEIWKKMFNWTKWNINKLEKRKTR